MKLSCDVVRDRTAELALGSLPGDERDEVLAHLSTCPACRREVERLADAADSLLLLAPVIEPPLGFETRAVERLVATSAGLFGPSPAWGPAPATGPGPRSMADAGTESGGHHRLVAPGGNEAKAAPGATRADPSLGPPWLPPPTRDGAVGTGPPSLAAPRPHTRRGWRVPLVAAGLVAASLVVGGAIGWASHRGSGTVAASVLPSSGLRMVGFVDAQGRQIGRVAVGGQPTWVVMTVDRFDDETYTCVVGLTDGRMVTIGRLTVVRGRGGWARTVEYAPSQLRDARLVDSAGRTVATAALA
jgi:hypothetical protein